MTIGEETSNGDQDPTQVRELAGFVDGLISAAIVKRTADVRVEDAVPEPMGADPSGPADPEVIESVQAVEPDQTERPERKSNGSRASMSEDLLDLFRNTQLPDPPSASVVAQHHTGPSAYLTQYLRQAEPSLELASSGFAELDERLGGGFGAGLHILQGRPGAGRTAFLHSMVLEAVFSGRPVRYYAFRDGNLGAWERLVSGFSHVLGGPGIPLSSIRAHSLTSDELEALAGIDLALQESVLPHLSLIETIPAHADNLWAFVEDIRSGVAETRKRLERNPLVVADDLESLMLLTGARPVESLLSSLDDALRADTTTCLVAVATPDLDSRDARRRPVQTVLTLAPASATSNGLSQMRLEVEVNARTGWTGTLPLVFDSRSGLLA